MLNCVSGMIEVNPASYFSRHGQGGHMLICCRWGYAKLPAAPLLYLYLTTVDFNCQSLNKASKNQALFLFRGQVVFDNCAYFSLSPNMRRYQSSN